jgi:hypothetical protein
VPVVALGAILAWGAVHYLHLGPREYQSFDERRREFQTAALRGFLARSSGGSLLPPNAVAIGVRGDLLQGILAASLPFTQAFEGGKYVARLDSARVELTDGLAVVHLAGEGSLAAHPAVAARLRVEGLLGIARLDVTNGHLVPQLVITDVRVVQAGPVSWRAFANPAARFFSRQKAREWNDLQAPLHLPLRLEPTLSLPRVDGDVSIPATDLPLAIRLHGVTVLHDRLVVSLDLLPDSATAALAPAGPAPAEAWSDSVIARRGPPLGRADFARLREQVLDSAARDTIWRAIEGADRDVVVIMPKVVLADLAGRAARRLRGGAMVDFRPEIAESLDKDVHITALGKKLGAGRIHLDIRVRHLRGRLLTLGAPSLAFRPPNALALDVPMGVTEGAGDAMLHARWDPAALVSIVCKGFETRLALSGAIRPFTQQVQGTIGFRLVNGTIVGRPVIRRDRMQIAFDLDARSWDKVRHVLQEQDRLTRCSVGIDPDAQVEQLRQLAARGVKVRLPPDLIPSFTLPVLFENAYEEGDVRVDVSAYEPAIVVRADYLSFGVDADLRVTRRPGLGGAAAKVPPSGP